MQLKQKTGIFCAVLAAALYSLNAPFSKLLLSDVSPTVMAALLYLGAGSGLFIVRSAGRRGGRFAREMPLTKADLPYTVGMVTLDVAAPILLMTGLRMTTAANVSLLNNFEIVATSLIALLLFGEKISPRLWLAIGLVTTASMILSFEGAESFSFSPGSVFVLLACVCWGFENNCTRSLSGKDPCQIVIIKGFGSGLGSLVIALFSGERFPDILPLLAALLLGFVAYGLSILFYIYAQRFLGAARTSAYYAVAPFIGAGVSLLVFRQLPSLSFLLALTIMALGAYFASCTPCEEKK
jgi:drug/metabolite transporter (DMT)-like permease